MRPQAQRFRSIPRTQFRSPLVALLAITGVFFLFTSGWDKDSDFHVASGTSIEPLPWHGLNDQTYATAPRPAFTNDAWMQQYNTRWVGPRILSRAAK